MIIKNGMVLTDEFIFKKTDVKVENGKISEIGSNLICASHEEVVDAGGKYVVPGLVDTHMHAAVKRTFIDFVDDTYEKIASYEASHGTTSLVPALSAAKKEKLLACIDYMNECIEREDCGCAKIRGIHMEGPFFAPEYKGAHLPENIRIPSLDEMTEYCNRAGENLKIMTLAPELPNAEEVIKYAVSKGVCISAGHTNSTYEDILNAMEWGATQGTHLYNAMSAMNHRKPNAVGGLLNSDAKCELICDFFHVHPAVVLLTFKIKGADKINMITDSEIGTGLSDGEYEVNGRTLTVKDKKTYTEDGTIAGGSTCLIDGVRNLVSIGIPLEDAIMTATKNPAESAKIYDEVGSISVGKIADILVLDEELQLEKIILRGQELKR